MGVMDSARWREDLDVTLSICSGVEKLAGRTVLVTGGTGLVLSPLVDLLAHCNDMTDAGIRIICAGRWESEVAGRFGENASIRGIEWTPYDASEPSGDLPACDFVIHGASNAHPAAIVSDPVGTLLSNVLGVGHLLDHARACDARLLYVSSSEVYGSGLVGPLAEEDCGKVSLLDARSSYPQGKRAAETLCASHMAQYGTDVVIVRPGHIYGPTASPTDNRVSSAWAWAAAKGEDILMMSDGAQVRSYCHCLDCATAIMSVLLHGETGTAYNVANPSSVASIAELGELLAEAGGVRLEHAKATKAQRSAFNPMADSSLDASRLVALGWEGAWSVKEGVRQTIAVLRQSMVGR